MIPPTFSARVADVGPGYDDRELVGHLPGYTGLVIDREDGELYRRGLTEAVLSGAPWLAIETWNEFHEATDAPRILTASKTPMRGLLLDDLS